MASLLGLPEDVILRIHFLAQSPLFPQTHPTIYAYLHRAPISYVARYLIRLYRPYGPAEILTRAVRHPICGVKVAREMRRIWDDSRGHTAWIAYMDRKRKRKGRRKSEDGTSDTDLKISEESDEDESPPKKPTVEELSCAEFPRRLFRVIALDRPIQPLLEYLLDTYDPSVNSHKGYPLCRAVYSGSVPLTKFLLEHGADPRIKDSLPVQIAIQKGSLEIVKLLVEPSSGGPTATRVKSTDGKTTGIKFSPRKRVKRDDRISIGSDLVEMAMKGGHEAIIHYFVHEKGVMPPLRSILKMGIPASIQVPPSARKQVPIHSR